MRSETENRWAEIRFFYFCQDIFDMRKNMLDVIYSIEAVSQIGNLRVTELKRIAGLFMGDPYYIPRREEVIFIANRMGYTLKQISEITGTTRQAVKQFIDRNQDGFYATNKCDALADEIIIEFLDLLDKFKKAGI